MTRRLEVMLTRPGTVFRVSAPSLPVTIDLSMDFVH